MFLLVHLRHLTLSLASHFTLRCAHGMQALYTRWYSYSRDPLPLLFAWSMGGYLGAMQERSGEYPRSGISLSPHYGFLAAYAALSLSF